MLSRDQILKIIHKEPEALVAIFHALYKQNEELRQRIEHLESIIKKNSSNSSKPPSSDGFNKPKRTTSLRKKSGKKAGGQKNHKGSTLKQVENPDFIEKCLVVECENCKMDLSDIENDDVQKRQVIDIPPITPKVTEFQAGVKDCPCCGTRNVGKFPSSVKDAIQYGSRIKSLSVYFMNYQFLPYQRLQECFKDVFGFNISPGSIYNFQKEGFNLLENTESQIKKDIKSSPIMHADESGFNVNGKRHWIHEYSTEDSTFYAHHEKRGIEAMMEIGMLNDYEGRCIHDHWDSYFFFECLHGLFNSHHLRELIFLEKVKKEAWAKKMNECLLAIKESVQFYKKKNRLPADLIKYYTSRYRRILKQGFDYHKGLPPLERKGNRGKKPQRPGKNMLDRLRGKEENVLAFMNDFKVPFDNNLGERDIRMTKVKQKISGCYRSLKGGDFFCRIRGYISTLRKRNKNVLDNIYNSFLNPASI